MARGAISVAQSESFDRRSKELMGLKRTLISRAFPLSIFTASIPDAVFHAFSGGSLRDGLILSLIGAAGYLKYEDYLFQILRVNRDIESVEMIKTAQLREVARDIGESH